MATLLNFLAANMGWLLLAALVGMLVVVASLAVTTSALDRRVRKLESSVAVLSAQQQAASDMLAELAKQ